jgi:hypothetical protein
LPAYGHARWPSPRELEDAAGLLKKSNIGKAFAAIGGSAKPVRDLVARLGMTSSKTRAEDLLALADHVDSLDQFDADAEAERLLGQSWDGFDTKFDQISFGIRARQYFAEQLGNEPTAKLIQIPTEAVRQLHQYEVDATGLRRTIARVENRLDDRSLSKQLMC